MRSIAIPATLLTGAIVSRWALAYAPARWHIDLAQPLAVATNWGAFGALLWLVLACTLALAFVFFLRGLAGAAPSRVETLVACALSLAAAFAWMPLFSSDVYAYAAYGEMARLGMDPYVHLTHPSADPILAAAQWQWSGAFPMCVYGYAFVALSAAVAGATHVVGSWAALEGLRALSALALLACAALLCTWSTRAAWFFALNPVSIWVAAEGHNDTIALAAVLAGFAIARKHAALGSAIAGAAASIKLTALGASAAFAFDALQRRARAFPILAGSVAGFAVTLAASLALIDAIRNDLAPHGRYLPLASVQTLGIPLAIAVAILIAGRIPSFNHRLDRWCVLGCALWMAIPNPYPWYALWLLAPSALAIDARVRACALAVGGASLLRYLPDAAALPAGIWGVVLGLCALAAFAPLALRRESPVL